MTASRFLNSKEVGSVYLHEDSVPNMAGSRGCFKKSEGEKAGGKSRASVHMRVKRWASAQQGSRGQTMQSRLCPAARFSSYSLQCSPEWLKSMVSPPAPKTKTQELLWKSNRERQATWLCRDAVRQVWEQHQRRILQLQPCRSSKTIAGLMQTLLTSEHCTDRLRWSQGLRALGQQRAKGNAFVTKGTRPTATYIVPSWQVFILWLQALKWGLNEI